MQSGLYVALSAQVALERRLNTVANNVANLSTVGYRAEEVKFETVLSEAGTGPVSFVSEGSTFVSRRPGSISKTDNPLDIAIQGDAWLSISTPSGVAYTKDGRMKMDANGAVQTMEGYPVLDIGGTPLVLDPTGGTPTIGKDGLVSQDGNQAGSLGLFKIDSRSNLTRTGNASVIPSIQAVAVQDFTSIGVQQGFTEGPNVNPVLEMTKLITISRAFDGASSTISESESTMLGAIRALGPSA